MGIPTAECQAALYPLALVLNQQPGWLRIADGPPETSETTREPHQTNKQQNLKQLKIEIKGISQESPTIGPPFTLSRMYCSIGSAKNGWQLPSRELYSVVLK